MDKGIETKILTYLRMLGSTQQNKVLSYIKSLIASPKQTPTPNPKKKAVLKWAGSIDLASLEEMELAIDEAFNKVDLNEW